MDPFSLSTGIVGLIAVALKLVVGALGMIDKTVAAYNEAADELKGLQQDLEQLQTQMVRVHRILKVLAFNTKDRGFKKLLQDEDGQVAVRELCDTLEVTFSTLTQMTDRTKSDDLRPAPLPSNTKSLEFTRAVLKHSFTPSKITDLVKGLRDMRFDVETCLTKLETTFEHVHALYDITNNGLARIASRGSFFSTSTNLTVRVQLAAWLKGLEDTWGLSGPHRSISLRDFLRSKHVTIGISHMTDDLLGGIFYHLCERGPLSFRHLLFVSRRFYSVAVNNAHLWTTISLDRHFLVHFHRLPDPGDKFIEQCLLRSGSLPLCLYIDNEDVNEPDATHILHHVETFRRPEWRGFQRCISLTWANWASASPDGHDEAAIQTLVELLPKSLPSLKTLSLRNFRDLSGGSQFPNCPVLERVHMSDHQVSSPHFWGANFLNVSTLTFGNLHEWAGHDLETLSLFPMLHELILFTTYHREDLRGVSSRLSTEPVHVYEYIPHMIVTNLADPIIFEHLHVLRVYGHIPPMILTNLAAPALEELHLFADYSNYTPIDALQISFNPLCRSIYALFPKTVSAQEPEWATKLSKLVQKCTMIESLHISRWMEKEYKKSMSTGEVVILHVQ